MCIPEVQCSASDTFRSLLPFTSSQAISGSSGALSKSASKHASGWLQAEGFSDAIIDRFFRPFLGGIFFDRELHVTSRLFEFVMRCLATGENCLPAKGIGAVAQQLAAQLPPDSIHTGAASYHSQDCMLSLT